MYKYRIIICGNPTCDPTPCLTEGWQLHQIVFRDRLQVSPSLTPRGQAADDHERVEPFFLQ